MDSVSVSDISDAARLLDEYCSGSSAFAWPLYDEDPSPRSLCGADLTAPALLSYPIRGRYLNAMGAHGTEYAVLIDRMSAFVATEPSSEFAQLDHSDVCALQTRSRGDEVDGPRDLQMLVACLDAVGNCKGLTSVAVTKILHRKRPDLVPIKDSRVGMFYNCQHSYADLFVAIHQDLTLPATQRLLDRLVEDRQAPLGRPLTQLRALDIVVWQHMMRS